MHWFFAVAAVCAALPSICDAGLESLLFDKKTEIELGSEVARQIEREHGVLGNAAAQARVTKVGEALVDHCGRTDLDYQFKVLASNDVNACALPGGFVYVFNGLAQQLSEPQLAAVVAHEIAHVAHKHGLKTLAKAAALDIIIEVLTGKKSVSLLAGAAMQVVMSGHSRDNEKEADAAGQRYLFLAGYDPEAMVELFGVLARSGGMELPKFLSSHPPTRDRVRDSRDRIPVLYVDYGDRRPIENPPRVAVMPGIAEGVTAGQAQAVASALAERLTRTGLMEAAVLEPGLGELSPEAMAAMGCAGALALDIKLGPKPEKRGQPQPLVLEMRTTGIGVPAVHATHECVPAALQPKKGHLDKTGRALAIKVVGQWLGVAEGGS